VESSSQKKMIKLRVHKVENSKEVDFKYFSFDEKTSISDIVKELNNSGFEFTEEQVNICFDCRECADTTEFFSDTPGKFIGLKILPEKA